MFDIINKEGEPWILPFVICCVQPRIVQKGVNACPGHDVKLPIFFSSTFNKENVRYGVCVWGYVVEL